MLEYVSPESGQWEVWSARTIAEDSPEDAHRLTATTVGLLLHSGDGDGALLIGEPAKLREYLRMIADSPALADPATVIDADPVRREIDAADTGGKTYDHRARPDDDPEPGDRCKDCGEDITWMGPSPYDWLHVDDEENQ